MTGHISSKRLTLHQLRFSFRSWLEKNKCPRAVRLRLMGQSRKGVSDHYNHSSDAAMREWLGKLWDASLLPLDSAVQTSAPELHVGTRTPSTGTKNGRSKLDEEKVRTIRKRFASEGDAAIAKDYGVDPQAIRQIRLGLT